MMRTMLAVLGLLAAAVPARAQYRIIDLGTLGGTWSYACAIGGSGRVVGYALTGEAEQHAFSWYKGVMTDLGTLAGSSRATTINERGQIVGRARTTGNEDHAVLWSPLPVITALEVSPRTPDAAAVHVTFNAVPPTSATTYHLETADAAAGPWTTVADAVLTELEPDRYQFTEPFDAACAPAFWRVIETVP